MAVRQPFLEGMLTERRRGPRLPVQIVVTYWVDLQARSEAYNVESENLSLDGMFIRLSTPLALGTDVALEFQLPGMGQDIRVNGQVVWSRPEGELGKRPPGKGIKFTDMNEEMKIRLKGYLQRMDTNAIVGEDSPGNLKEGV